MSEEKLRFIASGGDNNDLYFSKRVNGATNEIANIIFDELKVSNQVSLVSFGPSTKVTKTFVAGPTSLLSEVMSHYTDDDYELQIILENSNTKLPSDKIGTYLVTSPKDFPELYAQTETFPETDYLKISIFFANKAVVLLHLPSFPPFKSTQHMNVKLNGWDFIQNPKSLICTPAFCVLHFDNNLRDEALALYALSTRDITYPIREVMLPEASYSDYDEYSVAVSSDSRAEGMGRVIGTRITTKFGNNIDNTFDNENNAQTEISSSLAAHSQKRRRRSRRKDRNNVVRRKVRKTGEDGTEYSEYEYEYESTNTGRTGRKDDEIQIIEKDGKKFIRKVHRRKKLVTKKVRKNRGDGDDDSYGKTNADLRRDFNRYINEDDLKSTSTLSMLVTETDSEINIEELIRKFAYDVEFIIPELEDTAIFSTLFRQLYFEKWKNTVMDKIKGQMIKVRDHIKQLRTDELANLKALVESNDLTIFIAREEQKLRLIEAKTIEAIEQSIKVKIEKYQDAPQVNLYKTFKSICQEQVDLQRQVREKRAEIRSKSMDLRMRQLKRVELMNECHLMNEDIDHADEIRGMLKAAEKKYSKAQNELQAYENDRNALIAQRDKIQATLEQLIVSNMEK